MYDLLASSHEVARFDKSILIPSTFEYFCFASNIEVPARVPFFIVIKNLWERDSNGCLVLRCVMTSYWI